MDQNYNIFEWWKIACIDNFLNFSGRARRKEYWYFVLVSFLFFFVFSAFYNFLQNNLSIEIIEILDVISVLVFLFYLLLHLAVAVRRLHDTGKAGFYFFVFLIPIIGYILLFSYLVTDSNSGSNRYGYNPKLKNYNSEIDEIGVSDDKF